MKEILIIKKFQYVIHSVVSARQVVSMSKIHATEGNVTTESERAPKLVELLQEESSPMGFMYVPGVNTISFFTGDIDEAYQYYTEKLKQVLAVNPWLAGTLITKKEGKIDKVYLQYPEPTIDADVMTRSVLEKDSQGIIKVSPTYTYLENFKALNTGKNCLIPDGYTSISTKKPLSKFTLVPCDDGGFAFIVSISHVVSDGYTYYKVLSQLTTNGTIEELSTLRKQEYSEQVKNVVGQSQSDFIFGVNMYNMGFLYQMIWEANAIYLVI